jgi:hypothetical protein
MTIDKARLASLLFSRPAGAIAGILLVALFIGCMNISFGGRTSHGSANDPDLCCQEGIVKLNPGEDRIVYYPIPYQSPPNLEIEAESFRSDSVSLLEQKEDHFRIVWKKEELVFPRSSVQVTWKARGVRGVQPQGVSPLAPVESAPPPPTPLPVRPIPVEKESK